MSSKTKYKIQRLVVWIITIVIFIVTTAIYVNSEDIMAEWDAMITNNKINNIIQWLLLIGYRFIVYILPAIISIPLCFDKRCNKRTRYLIWQNQVFGMYLLFSAIIKALSLDMIEWLPFEDIFNALDPIVFALGFLMTMFTKRKIDFDNNSFLIDKKSFK